MKFEPFDFKPNYECNPAPELISGNNPQTFYFTFPDTTLLGSGLIVDVEPLNQDPWRGYFDWGHGKLNKVCACPQKNYLCVVANGQGYVVNVLNPQQFYIVGVDPVRDVQAAVGCSVLILIDFADVYTLGVDGPLWSKQLVSDELKISTIEDDKVCFTGWIAEKDRYIDLCMNVYNGDTA